MILGVSSHSLGNRSKHRHHRGHIGGNALTEIELGNCGVEGNAREDASANLFNFSPT